ncbi:hypothetical protein I302_104801 [Kwoniella bestiolae CBS 10118]|uniref:RRM domain-containing protein n=1 Tax=Kwoniella bestiolae CBS 10118 TaxID=1296100 RepID=A0A1B9FRR4_9TREE|nr:hypothetical protein I302_09130 [Kwoniella bestiolae CBS 10118]OCF21451.1 hypothetical protein I302_09130 [Kwoniella bestiolae CBS 10118]
MVEAVLNPIKQATENVVAAANEFVAGKPSTAEEDAKKIADIPKEDDGHRIYIGNIDYNTTKEQVQEFVAPVGGEIKSIDLPLKFGKRPAGYAFVTYTNEADANKAAEQLKDKEFGNRQPRIELARPAEKVLEIRKAKDERRKQRREEENAKKAEKAAESATAAGVAPEANGKPAEGEEKPKKKRNNKSKAKKSRRRLPGEGDEGEAEAETSGSAEPASKGRIDVNDGEGEAKEKKKKAVAAKPKKERQPRLELTGDDSKNTIFVANLPFSVDDEALATIFTNLSIKVKSAKVVQGIRRPRQGAARTFKPFRASKGFGFVEIENEAEQAQAVEKVDGTLVEDRKITAKIAKEMRPIEQEEVKEAQANGNGDA